MLGHILVLCFENLEAMLPLVRGVCPQHFERLEMVALVDLRINASTGFLHERCGLQMDWLSKRQTEATEATGRYTWHQQPTAKASVAHGDFCK